VKITFTVFSDFLKMPFKERRKFPRVTELIPCRVVIGSKVCSTQTHNLSCGGALCQLAEAIPPLTKLDVTIQLPTTGLEFSTELIHCVGVVVRQEPPLANGPPLYPTAIYFLELRPKDRQRIAGFVLQSMLAHDRRRS
jgi:hypothetical protein